MLNSRVAIFSVMSFVPFFSNGLSLAQDPCCHEWQETSTSGGPLAREGFSAIYDSVRNVTVVFGGCHPSYQECNPLSDTWEWDGSAWSFRTDSGPAPRYDSFVAFDSARGVVVLYGGWLGTRGSIDEARDTWEWNGVEWSLRSTTSSIGQPLAIEFDPTLNRIIKPATWGWNGSTWSQINNANTSGIGRRAMMVHDVARGVVMLAGGSFTNPERSTWEWQGTAWALKDHDGPFIGTDLAAYDSDREIIVTLGAYGSGYLENGSYVGSLMAEWDGVKWGSHATRTRPRGLSQGLVYDTARHQLTAFGSDENDSKLIVSRYMGKADCDERALPAALTKFATTSIYHKRNRYLAFEAPFPTGCGVLSAIRVQFLGFRGGSAACGNVPDFSAYEGRQMWVGPEVFFNGAPSHVYSLQAEPMFRDWSTVALGQLRISDCNIVPCADYQIDTLSELDWPEASENRFSESFLISTTDLWADVNSDGAQDFRDILAAVDCFRGQAVTPQSACDLAPNNPAQGALFNIDFADIAATVDAFRGNEYPFSGPTAPASCP